MMLHIARMGGESAPVSLTAVAEAAALSRGYLEQLALALRNARLLRGVCGKGGGYQLARAATEISAREIVEAISGPIAVVECVESQDTCLRAEFCECRPLYLLINQKIVEALESFTLADLTSGERMRALAFDLARPGPGGNVAEGGCPDHVGTSRKTLTSR